MLTVGPFIWIAGAMYSVTAIAGADISIAPPLRAAVAAGDPIEGSGTIAMKLASAAEGVLTITGGSHQRVTASLIEEI